MVTEGAKTPMVPGVGIAPNYTISRAILSDAVALVRGDRFYTVRVVAACDLFEADFARLITTRGI